MDPSYRLIVEQKLREFLLEDARFSDVSSALIPESARGKATIIAKESGIVCGLVEIEALFDLLGCKLSPMKKDGDAVAKRDVVASVEGPVRAILLGERTALNLLMHLSGVATRTREFQAIIEKERVNPRCKVAATRKTIPGLRAMEKRAVVIGGGDTHRWSLDDMVMLKDNHLAYFENIETMIQQAKQATSFSKKIEVEVTSVDDALKAARAGADIIMLDNMPFDDMRKAVQQLDKAGLRNKIILESSGNVEAATLPQHAKTGVDWISTSAITLKARPVDFSLELSANRDE
nr:carboxylating nicotinate-nucleotide diphosphorylase [Candidatus Sigynarchaeota archaeon]